ncbi:MAG: glycosyl transferase family 2, partial [Lachnospiraceae bacterium]|nr:glycosyl transferase family 2 [Lachnospiraceae bacterium]
ELSMNAGRDLSVGDFVFEFDTLKTDYDDSLIEEVFGYVKEGFDIVAAAPKRSRNNGSALFYKFFKEGNTDTYTMRTETFRVLTRRVINRVTGMNVFIPYRKAVYAYSGYRMKTVVYNSTAGGTGKAFRKEEKKYRRELALEALLLFTSIGYRLSIGLTFLMMLIALLIGLYTVVVYLTGSPVEGWTTTMLFLSFGFFGLFALLSIVIKYLSMILEMVFKKQKYYVAGVEKIACGRGESHED